MTGRGPSLARLCRLLVWIRLRSAVNAARGPRAGAARLAGAFGLLVPVAYVGLFSSAFSVIGEQGGHAAQRAALVAIAGGVVLASVGARIARGDGLVEGGGEGELLLARPIGLPRLALARCLSGAVTDPFGALFLLPILASAAFSWGLGAWGLVLAALVSIVAQVGVLAAAQTIQIAAVHLAPPSRRRLVGALFALAAALTMAALWMVGSWVLRRPEAAALALRQAEPWLARAPAALVVAPLDRLAAGCPVEAGVRLALLVALVIASLLALHRVARWASRRGWEFPGAPWAEASRGVPAPSRGLGIMGKEWRLLLRDRARLVALLAMPSVFVGVQVFGSAGWDWATAEPRNVALLAYSLAAYAATLGPLAHMQGEGRALWILTTSPRPLGHVFAAKAAFWSLVLGAFTAATYAAVAAAAGRGGRGDLLVFGALAVVGAVLSAWLAVGLACSTADLSDSRPRGVGIGTMYLFLLAVGLYNVALLEDGVARGRVLLLEGAAVALCWVWGISRARTAFEPEESGRRRSPGDGALFALVLFAGRRAANLVETAAGATIVSGSYAALWSAAVAAGVVVYVVRRPADPSVPRRWWAAALGGAVLAAAAAIRLLAVPPPALGLLAPVAIAALSDELAVRGVVQPGVIALARGRGRSAGAVALSAIVALALESSLTFGTAAVASAALPALALVASGRLWVACLVRLAILCLTFVPGP